jgi:hypothetical protein
MIAVFFIRLFSAEGPESTLLSQECSCTAHPKGISSPASINTKLKKRIKISLMKRLVIAKMIGYFLFIFFCACSSFDLGLLSLPSSILFPCGLTPLNALAPRLLCLLIITPPSNMISITLAAYVELRIVKSKEIG